MPNFENRIAKIEEQLGVPSCVCRDRREGMVILSEFGAPATREEIEDFHNRAFWTCPAHGPCHALLAVRLRLSNYGSRQPAALTYRPEELYGY